MICSLNDIAPKKNALKPSSHIDTNCSHQIKLYAIKMSCCVIVFYQMSSMIRNLQTVFINSPGCYSRTKREYDKSNKNVIICPNQLRTQFRGHCTGLIVKLFQLINAIE